MSNVSNELSASAFVSNLPIQVSTFLSPSIQLQSVISPQIKFVPHKPVMTPKLKQPKALTIILVPRDSEIDGWRLKACLLVQIHSQRNESLAMTWLEGIAEYGVAKDDSEAIVDLVVSIGEYRESLEKLKDKLGDSAQTELEYLRKLIERAPGKFI